MDKLQLSNLSKMWKSVAPIAAGFSPVADGEYVGDLKEMKLENSKNSGRLQVAWSFEIADGDYAGKTVKRFDGVGEEAGVGFFKGCLEVIGLDLSETPETWQEEFDAFIANPERVDLYKIALATTQGKDKKNYQNLYINGISEYTKGGEGAVAEGEAVVEGDTYMDEAGNITDAEGNILETVAVAEEQPIEVVEEQQIAPPLRRFTKPVAAKPAVAAKPVAKPVTQMRTVAQAKPVAQPVAQGGVRRIVAKK